MLTGETQQFTATVTGAINTAVTWSVDNVTGGNTSVGTISSAGLYSAPATAPGAGVTIRATSQASATASATANVSVTAPLVTTLAAVRFLEQSSFGPTAATIRDVRLMGFQAYLADQFTRSGSTFSDSPNSADPTINGNPTTLQREFFTQALTARDQLRLRAAWALHKIWVVSWIDVNRWDAFAPYLRMHLAHAFDNYRNIMENVTKNAAMGSYQDIANNDKADPARGTSCNENYGRELMQLFTVGVWQRNMDGSFILDGLGNPMPTYDQAVVEDNACALTGWTYMNAPGQLRNWPRPPFYGGPLEAVESHHDTSAKTLLSGFVLPAGQTTQQDLTGTLNNINTYPSTAPHVARLLIQQFVTSNPSPAYVNRVATAYVSGSYSSGGITFGTGTRGDMRALLAATLLDAEARRGDDPAQIQAGDGKMREPVLLVTGLLRALGGVSDGAGLLSPTAALGQRVLFPPTVFSYFSPDFQAPGTGLFAPELQLHTTYTALVRINLVNTLVYASLGNGTTLDLTPWAALAADPNNLVNTLDALLLHGAMSSSMRTSILTAVNAAPSGANQNLERARAAIYLIASSSQYQVQR